MLKGAFEVGYPKAASVGACAIVTVIKGNKLYVANAGDCEGVLLKKTESGLESIKICKAYSANDPDEQKRLKEEHPGENDIIHCRSRDA